MSGKIKTIASASSAVSFVIGVGFFVYNFFGMRYGGYGNRYSAESQTGLAIGAVLLAIALIGWRRTRQ